MEIMNQLSLHVERSSCKLQAARFARNPSLAQGYSNRSPLAIVIALGKGYAPSEPSVEREVDRRVVMSRQNELERRHRGWRDLALAGVAAAAVTLLLVVAVALVWLLGRSPSQAPVLAGQSRSTPTPRSLTFVRNTPTPAATVAAAVPTATTVVPSADTAPTRVATPEPTAVSTESATTPAAESGEDIVFEAPGRDKLETLASGSWSVSEDVLLNEGSSAVAEPWLVLSAVPSADVAVEVEMRVTSVLESVCDQSFGLVAGSPSAGQVYGGGLIFPCASDTARARLTDVSVWENGYNADSVLAEKTFDPGNEWHTYRFELRGDELRLLVDGADVVSGMLEAPIDASSGDAQAGLWAQGVQLKVRKVSVHVLPPA